MASKIVLSISLLAAAMGMVSGAPHWGQQTVKSYNGGHNVESTNENKFVDASDLFVGVDVLKRNAPSFSKYNGGHNVESNNENKGLDLSGLNLGLDIL